MCMCARNVDNYVSLLYRIHHQKSRYVYELFYKRKAISRGKLSCFFCKQHLKLISIPVSRVVWVLPRRGYSWSQPHSKVEEGMIIMRERERIIVQQCCYDVHTHTSLPIQSGYENLCCLRCIQPRDTNFGTTCICRVPKSKLETVRNQLLIGHCINS